ncbi:DUF2199 domain-containing protein [Pedobacter sp. PWIIR3]
MEKYTCSHCGGQHDDWPALAYFAPINYDDVSSQYEGNFELNDDFCIMDFSDRVDFFIRCTLKLNVTDHCDELDYGVWVSLIESSFNNYSDNFFNEDHQVSYFGWLSSSLIGYENTVGIPMNVITQIGNSRPLLVPHRDHDHPLVREYFNGISKEEAENRIAQFCKQWDFNES